MRALPAPWSRRAMKRRTSSSLIRKSVASCAAERTRTSRLSGDWDMDVQESLEHRPAGVAHAGLGGVECGEQARCRARAERPLEVLGVCRHIRPLPGHLWRDLEMELHAVGPVDPKRLVWVCVGSGEPDGA